MLFNDLKHSSVRIIIKKNKKQGNLLENNSFLIAWCSDWNGIKHPACPQREENFSLCHSHVMQGDPIQLGRVCTHSASIKVMQHYLKSTFLINLFNNNKSSIHNWLIFFFLITRCSEGFFLPFKEIVHFFFLSFVPFFITASKQLYARGFVSHSAPPPSRWWNR